MVRKTKNLFKNLSENKKYIIFPAIIILAFVAISIFANNMLIISNNEQNMMTKEGSIDLRINEYIVKNNSTFRDEKGESPDWIEIYNYGEDAIWLGNIYLSDDIEAPEKYKLADISLQAGEYFLVLASGETDEDDGYCRASFKLGEDDKTILLYCNGNIIDKLDIVYLPTDISAGYNSYNDFGYFAQPTPGGNNSTELFGDYNIVPVNPYEGIILINEYLSKNKYNVVDETGNHCDWIEIYNPNEYPIFLGDFFLSDDEYELNKYKLPDVELEASQYLVIHASDNLIVEQGSYCAAFQIGTDDKMLILSYKSGYIADIIDVYDLPVDISAGISDSGSLVFYDVPTPGEKNNLIYSESPDILAKYTTTASVVINEWMPNNQYGILDAEGGACDWIEIYNPTDEEFLLDGFGLTDDVENLFKWTFPMGTKVEAQGYLIVYASGKNQTIQGQLHTDFCLGEGDTIYLTEPSAAIADSAYIETLPGNVSKGRTNEGYGYFSLPTPGFPNNTDYYDEIEADIEFLTGQIYISEVSSSDVFYNRYLSKSLYEYIELYNGSEETINLEGYSLQENSGNFFFLNEQYIEPDKYLLVALKGKVSGAKNIIYATNLSLNSAGEKILLKNAQGIIIDYFNTGYLLGQYSSGRDIGSENQRVFFTEKTPGYENPDISYSSYANTPMFSHEGGMLDENIILTITANGDDEIYYTLDGNEPSCNSKLYTEPIYVNKNTVVRAIAISEGKLPSIIATQTYILEYDHEIPIICLTSPPAGLFYYSGGIYADGPGYGIGEYPYKQSNFFKNWERPVAVEYYTKDGQQALCFNAGIQIAGGYTRVVPQKSLVIRIRDEYGISEIDYPFFDHGTTLFRNLYLRNAGQDGWKTKIRDCFIQNSAEELGTIDTKRGRPVAVYINGEYWGLYNLRDKLNEDYLAIKHGIDKDQINIITEYSSIKNGSNKEWLELKEFCENTNFSKQENYEILCDKVDVQAFMDYIIIETFYGNVDTHNINFWKPDTAGSKWKPLLFDLDLSIRGVDYSMIQMYLGSSDLGFDSHIIKSLAKNSTFKEMFLNRYVYILNEVFTEEYFIYEINKYEEEIRVEMTYHLQRWDRPSSMEYWEKCMNVFLEGVLERRYQAVEELQQYFDLDDDLVHEMFDWYVG